MPKGVYDHSKRDYKNRKPRKANYNVSLTIWISKKDSEQLKQLSKKTNKSISNIVRDAIENFCNNDDM